MYTVVPVIMKKYRIKVVEVEQRYANEDFLTELYRSKTTEPLSG